MRVAKDNGIRLRDYGLPEDENDLHRKITSNPETLEKLLGELANTQEMRALQRKLKEKPK